MREWRQRNPEKELNIVLRKNYGITLDDYNAMLDAQGGVCALCGEACCTGKKLAVDHDHASGKIRGLLCQRCNTGIGKLRDDPDLLDKAAEYIRAHR